MTRMKLFLCILLIIITLIAILSLDISGPNQYQSVESVSTFPVCTQVFGNSTKTKQSVTNSLCGSSGSNSLLEPVTLIQLSVKAGSLNVGNPDSSGSASEKLTFQGFPDTITTQSQIDSFDPNEPCNIVKPPAQCKIFSAPMTISWQVSPITQKYRLRQIADNFPYTYLKYNAVVDYSEDDEGDQDDDDDGGGNPFRFNVDPCLCAYVSDKSKGIITSGDADKSNCDKLRHLKSGGKHATNYGHYLDDSCSNQGILGVLANYTFNRLNGKHIGGSCDKSNPEDRCLKDEYQPLFNCPGKVDNKTTTPCQFCTIQRNLRDPPKKTDVCKTVETSDLETNAVWYNRGTIMSCAGFLLNQANTIAKSAVELSEPCKSYINKPLANRRTRDPSTFPLSGKYTAINNDGSQDTQGACQVCIASYKSTSTIPGMWGSWRKCSYLINDWQDAFATLLSTNQNQKKGALFADDEGNPTTQDEQTFYYRSTPFYQASSGSGVKERYKCCRFVLPPSESSQLLGKCSPDASGDFCWGSYNEPPDFVAKSVGKGESGSVSDGVFSVNFPSGYEDVPPVSNINDNNGAYKPFRGLALTPYFMDSTSQSKSGGSSSDGGYSSVVTSSHLYRCGHYCSDFGKNEGSLASNAKSEFDKGYVKGWTGLGPFCKAYEVDLFSTDLFEVLVTVDYAAEGNVNTTETIRLSSSSIGSGTPIGSTSGNAGVVARIDSARRVDGASADNKLGGVLVICGATVKASDGASTGKLSGTMGPGISVATNPWNMLKQIQSNLHSGVASGGSKSIARAVPVPSFITLLQCFSLTTACLPPREICESAFVACRNINGGDNKGLGCTVPFEYINLGSNPAQVIGDNCNNGGKCSGYSVNNPPSSGYIIKDIYDVDPDGKSECVCCSSNADQNDQPQGQAWYWLPETNRKAFGKECGQYGMSLDYGKDDSTAQYVCSSPGDSVRCVPGFDDISADTSAPCTVIGGLVDYYGKTSCFSAVGDPTIGQCYATDESGSNTGCDESVIANVPLPRGVPEGWNPTIPNFWVDFFAGGGPGLYYAPHSQSTYDIDIALYVSGAALTADITNISPGKILVRPPGQFKGVVDDCSFMRGGLSSQSILPFYVQNTGSIASSYTATFNGCSGIPKGAFIIDESVMEVNNVPPAGYKESSFSGSLSASVQLSTIQCSISLSPINQPNLILDSVAIGCQVISGKRVTGDGDNSINVDGSNKKFNTTCPAGAFWCLIENGGWEVEVFSYVILGSLLCVTAFAIYLTINTAQREMRYDKAKNEMMKIDKELYMINKSQRINEIREIAESQEAERNERIEEEKKEVAESQEAERNERIEEEKKEVASSSQSTKK